MTSILFTNQNNWLTLKTVGRYIENLNAINLETYNLHRTGDSINHLLKYMKFFVEREKKKKKN